MIAGIWDCLSSQDVVDFVRYQVSMGKELTEIGEMICDHCLSPFDQGTGCDNMTIVIVAITHGRSKKEWYEWIANRVKENYGYKTPSAPPELYPQSRLTKFRADLEIFNEDERKRKEAAKRKALASAQSAPSPTQAPSQNDSS